MKKNMFLAVALCAALAVGGSLYAGKKHPNLVEAHKMIKHAIAKIDAAQKANEFDMGGHAQKAKELLEQAESELKLAAEAADKSADKAK